MEYNLAGEYVLITAILLIIGLWLENYEPPLKPQWIALTILTFGLVLGHFMIANTAYGFCIAGLAFYKRTLVDELREIMSILRKEKRNEQT